MKRMQTMPIANQAAEPEAPAKPKLKPFDPAGAQLAEHAYRTWVIDLATCKRADGKPATLDNLMQPAAWGNAERINVDDRIRVIAADKSFDFELVVKGKAPGLGLLLEPNDSCNPASPAYQALLQIQNAVQAETDAQRAELNRQHGIAR